MIAEDIKTIFIHIPKTGGTSIEAFLKSDKAPLGSDHSTLAEYSKVVDISEYYIFSFVRNPYTRAFSLFNYYKNGGNQQQYKYGVINALYDFVKSGGQHFIRHSDIEIAKKIPQNFPDFCKKYFRDKTPFYGRNALLPQIDYLTHHQKIGTNFIGKFENLNDDFQIVATQLGKKGTLPHLRRNLKSKSNSKIDDETQNIIFDFYQKDFEAFKY